MFPVDLSATVSISIRVCTDVPAESWRKGYGESAKAHRKVVSKSCRDISEKVQGLTRDDTYILREGLGTV